MVKARIRLRLDCRDGGGWLARDALLPGAPQPGRRLAGLTSSPEDEYRPAVALVTWDADAGRFDILLEADDTPDDYPLAETLAYYGPAWTFTPDGTAGQGNGRAH